MLSFEEFPVKVVKMDEKHRMWYEYRSTNICLDGVLSTNVCVRAYSLQDVFVPAGQSSLWAFHQTERENERKKGGKKERKKEGQRKRERQKYREREDTLGQTDHQWPSFPQLCQWLNWSLLPGWLCVWMRCVRSQNTHRWSYFSKWMSYNHINMLDGCGVFLWLGWVDYSIKAQNDHQNGWNAGVYPPLKSLL